MCVLIQQIFFSIDGNFSAQEIVKGTHILKSETRTDTTIDPKFSIELLFALKGQLISKCPFGVIISTKNNNDFLRIFVLVSKKRSIKKNNGTLYH